MYNSLRQEIGFEINFLDWPKYKGEKTYGEVAKRIIVEHQIGPNDVVGGSSLGGMVALEIAARLDSKAVALIGSALDPNDIAKLLTMLSPLASITPLSLIQKLAGKHENLVSQMFSDSDPDFIRAMCAYLREWPGYNGSLEKVKRIHGRKDHIIPCPHDGCEVIENAGHLIAITHARECAAFLETINPQLA
jgi:pimeloyl-ACP methyl ester carboxylesterase